MDPRLEHYRSQGFSGRGEGLMGVECGLLLTSAEAVAGGRGLICMCSRGGVRSLEGQGGENSGSS